MRCDAGRASAMVMIRPLVSDIVMTIPRVPSGPSLVERCWPVPLTSDGLSYLDADGG